MIVIKPVKPSKCVLKVNPALYAQLLHQYQHAIRLYYRAQFNRSNTTWSHQ